MKSRKLLIAFITVILAALSVTYYLSLERETYIYKVSYLPFGIHTYGAISEERIDEIACFIFEMKSRNIDKLYRNVLRSYKKSHVYKGYLDIRAKMIRTSDGKTIYISQGKEVVYEGRQYDIDISTIKAVARDIYEGSKTIKNRFEEDPYMCEQPDKFDEKLFGF